jgi:acetyl-CoA decarbonylase/synthase complex subunit gamma
MNPAGIKKNPGTLEMLPMAPAGEPGLPPSQPAPLSLPSLDQSFVVGAVETPAGKVPQVSSVLQGRDRWGSYRVRWGIRRMQYTVEPGLYALGLPDPSAPVLVTANYKMTFDRLREALPGRNAWVLVLDTKGVNVWCAAGKGTFGTEELVVRIRTSGLDQVVNHYDLILPQLGAPGVAAHLVKKLSGFKVIYGPIRAIDLPAFLDGGLQATPGMRRKTFPFKERAVLVPIELVAASKVAVWVLPVVFILGGLKGAEGFWTNALSHGLFAVIALLLAILVGGVFTPLLLPFLPARAFALKGFFLSLPAVIIFLYLWEMGGPARVRPLEKWAWVLLIPAVSAYLAMNFTGASTYTSLSGVKKEMRWAVPCEIAGAAAGLMLWLGALFLF